MLPRRFPQNSWEIWAGIFGSFNRAKAVFVLLNIVL